MHLGTLVALVLGASTLALPARAQSITVSTTADDRLNNGNCTLREAVIAANTNARVDACEAGGGADTVLLPAGSFVLTIAGAGEDASATGDLDITEDLTVEGASLITTSISGNNLDRTFEVLGNSHLTLTHLTIEGGSGTVGGLGGAIRINGSGALTLATARVRDTAADTAPAVYAATGATVNLYSSRVENNQSGGLYFQIGSTGLVRDSSITGNNADMGAGISVNALSELTLVNSTVSDNLATISGAGILAGGDVKLYNVTIAENVASASSVFGHGGGVFIGISGTVFAANSLLGNNINFITGDPDDCAGILVSGDSNLIESVTGCTLTGLTFNTLVGVDPLLGTLGNHGGPTLTQPLLAGSPAIDAGWSAGCGDENLATLLTDQRAYLRNGVCDIGAFEYASAGLATATQTTTPTRTLTPTRTATRTVTRTATATLPPSTTPSLTLTVAVSSSPAGTSTPCVPGGDRLCATVTVAVTPIPCVTGCLYLPSILDGP